MFGRLLLFLFWLAVAGVGGFGLAQHFGEPHLLLGSVVVAALLWVMHDNHRFGQVLRWLHAEGQRDSGVRWGVWVEIVERMRRLLRNREQESLERQSRLDSFLSALQASPNGVMLLDGQSHIEWCNATSASHFGLDSERDKLQLVGNMVRDPGFIAYLAGGNFHSSLSMPGRNSTTAHPVMLSVQLHPYGDGRKLLLSRDITLLEQAEAMRRDFVANVSHEIRTPLTVLAGFVETLQTLELSDAERQSYLALMAQQAERMQTLVTDLLTLSKLEGSPPPASNAVPVVSLMRQLEQDATSLSRAASDDGNPGHHISFTNAFDGELLGARSELLSAMSNLVSNAVRYTPLGGSIHVSMSRAAPDAAVQFSVTDSGPGIAEEHLGRLTERFYRVDRSRSRETGGTGLGLAIVKHVAQRHGAKLTISSIPGQGSVFSIDFPTQRVRAAPEWADAGTAPGMLGARPGAQ